jgi:RNA polymerase sigma-70 factor (ECF subfamily)
MLNLAPPAGEDDLDDTVLVREAQRSPDAFGLIYERHVDAVYSYLRSRVDTSEDAADLTQQTFLQALKALSAYRVGPVPFRAWLFRIARNLAINYRRSQRANITFDLLPEPLRPRLNCDYVSGLEQAENLQHVFGLLDPGSRELLILRFASQLTYREIGAAVGLGEDATRKRITRILNTIKEHYHDQ